MIEVRRYGAEVRLPMLAGREEFDRYTMDDCGVTTVEEIEEFCAEVRKLGGTGTTRIASGRRSMWVLVPHPEEGK